MYQLHILKDLMPGGLEKKKYLKKSKRSFSSRFTHFQLVRHTILCFAPAAAVFTITVPVTVLYPAKEYGSICL